jgi:hypothetical protein
VSSTIDARRLAEDAVKGVNLPFVLFASRPKATIRGATVRPDQTSYRAGCCHSRSKPRDDLHAARWRGLNPIQQAGHLWSLFMIRGVRRT